MTPETHCLVCETGCYKELIDFGIIPTYGLFLDQSDRHIPVIHHSFAYCEHCAFIRCSRLEEKPDYSHISRPTGRQTPAYLPEIIQSLSQYKPAPGGLIIDVGGNDGSLLNILAKKGYNKRLNIEPSIALAQASASAGNPTECTHLDPAQAETILCQYGPADVVFCRHVIEHVPSPLDFLQSIHVLLDSEGLLFLETPDAHGIIHNLLGHELWEEHLSHFSLDNLRWLLQRTGFEVVWEGIRPHRGGTNLLFWVKKAKQPIIPSICSEKLETSRYACSQFKNRWSAVRKYIQAELDGSPKPVVCIGASHPQTNYLIFTGIGKYISRLVDDNLDKIGRIVPLPDLVPVQSTAQLLNGTVPGTIIRTAFGCEEWMDTICKPLAGAGTRIMEPYPEPNSWLNA